MDEKRKMIEAELKALGINTIDELNEAIKKEKLDVTLMVAPIPNKKAAKRQQRVRRSYERNIQKNSALGNDCNAIRDSLDRHSVDLLPNGRTARYCMEIKIAPIESGISYRCKCKNK